jgi:hypothetical protein
MENLYNAEFSHANWNILKEIDMLASAWEIFMGAILSITQNMHWHSKFTEATVLKFLKSVVIENPSCMRDLAYQTYVTKWGEVSIQSAIGSKGGTVGVEACGITAARAAEKVKKKEYMT